MVRGISDTSLYESLQNIAFKISGLVVCLGNPGFYLHRTVVYYGLAELVHSQAASNRYGHFC